MKGIILAGGHGERLYPMTRAVSKQSLSVYDKPMIYYPLSTLIEAGIRQILIISTPRDIRGFQELLGTGKQLGMEFTYAVQERPGGLAEAFLIGEDFIGGEDVALILGDNLFHGANLPGLLNGIGESLSGAVIFGYHVNRPQDYGVLEFDRSGRVLSIEEKPKKPKSGYVVPGLYFYDGRIAEIAKTLTPSKRGELEITDINNIYLSRGELRVKLLGDSVAWMDAGTPETLLDASNYVAAFQKRQGKYIACIEEAAYRAGFIGRRELLALARPHRQTAYGRYLYDIARLDQEKETAKEEGRRAWDI